MISKERGKEKKFGISDFNKRKAKWVLIMYQWEFIQLVQPGTLQKHHFPENKTTARVLRLNKEIVVKFTHPTPNTNLLPTITATPLSF